MSDSHAAWARPSRRAGTRTRCSTGPCRCAPAARPRADVGPAGTRLRGPASRQGLLAVVGAHPGPPGGLSSLREKLSQSPEKSTDLVRPSMRGRPPIRRVFGETVSSTRRQNPRFSTRSALAAHHRAHGPHEAELGLYDARPRTLAALLDAPRAPPPRPRAPGAARRRHRRRSSRIASTTAGRSMSGAWTRSRRCWTTLDTIERATRIPTSGTRAARATRDGARRTAPRLA